MEYDVLVLGDYYCDLIFAGLPHMPALGEEVFGARFEMAPGGAFIPAVALRRLGVRVGWAADFGDDLFSAFVLERARAEGLDASLFRLHGQPVRRISVAASFPHDRAFLTYADPNPARLRDHIKTLCRARARLAYLNGLFYGPTADMARRLLRRRGMQIVMECQSTGETLDNPAVRRAIEGVDAFMPNSVEAQQLTGASNTLEAMDALADLCPLVVIKDGPAGAHAAAGGRRYHAPSLPVTPLDTTGAGDCFNAGFVKAWLEGLPVETCLQWGNVCGGLSTTALGGATAAPRLAEVQQWLERDRAM